MACKRLSFACNTYNKPPSARCARKRSPNKPPSDLLAPIYTYLIHIRAATFIPHLTQLLQPANTSNGPIVDAFQITLFSTNICYLVRNARFNGIFLRNHINHLHLQYVFPTLSGFLPWLKFLVLFSYVFTNSAFFAIIWIIKRTSEALL